MTPSSPFSSNLARWLVFTTLTIATCLFIFPPTLVDVLADPANPLKPENPSLSLDISLLDDVTGLKPGGEAKTTSLTIATTTDNPAGYTTTLKTKSEYNCLQLVAFSDCSNYKIDPVTGTLTALSMISPNQWGATLADLSTSPNTDKGNDQVWFAVPDGGENTQPVTVDSSSFPTATTGTPVIVTFGVKVDYSIPADTYLATVVFTAMANDYRPDSPTITSVSPSYGSMSGG
ncbi:MAG: hypothetical protein LBE03_01295, partial [Candidatus Nomurabacteria bacterium]|nr:hypothetical protein [Candidatus Nomurabacteria bacterium]